MEASRTHPSQMPEPLWLLSIWRSSDATPSPSWMTELLISKGKMLSFWSLPTVCDLSLHHNRPEPSLINKYSSTWGNISPLTQVGPKNHGLWFVTNASYWVPFQRELKIAGWWCPTCLQHQQKPEMVNWDHHRSRPAPHPKKKKHCLSKIWTELLTSVTLMEFNYDLEQKCLPGHKPNSLTRSNRYSFPNSESIFQGNFPKSSKWLRKLMWLIQDPNEGKELAVWFITLTEPVWPE